MPIKSFQYFSKFDWHWSVLDQLGGGYYHRGELLIIGQV